MVENFNVTSNNSIDASQGRHHTHDALHLESDLSQASIHTQKLDIAALTPRAVGDLSSRPSQTTSSAWNIAQNGLEQATLDQAMSQNRTHQPNFLDWARAQMPGGDTNSGDTTLVAFRAQPGDPVQAAQRNLADVISQHGANSMEAVMARRGLALAFMGNNNLDQAAAEIQRTLDVLRNLNGIGPNHPQFAISEGMLATLRIQQGRWGDATPLLQDAARISNLPENRNDPICRAVRAIAERQLAVANDGTALNQAIQQHGPNSLQVADARRRLAVGLMGLGNFGQAADQLTQCLQNVQGREGQNSPNYALTQSILGIVREQQGRPQDALPLYTQALATLQNNNQNGQFDGQIREMQRRIRALQQQQ